MNEALRSAAIRRLLAAYLAFKAAEWGTWVAVLIFAYGADGPAAVGIVAVAQLVPATVAAPLAPHFITRLSRLTGALSPLAVAYLCQALAIGATAAAVATGPSVAVYVFAVVMTATMSFARPAHAAALVEVAQSPTELSAGNGLGGLIDGLGIVIGPAIAGLFYGTVGPAAFLALMCGAMLIAALMCRTLGRSGVAASESTGGASFRSTLRLVGRTHGALVAITGIAAASVVAGIIDVLIVVAALGPLHAGEAAVGLLNAALGSGVMVAGIMAARFVRVSSAIVVAVGLALAALGLAATGASESPVLIGGLLAVSGLGLGMGEVASRNLLLRLVPAGSVADVFGLVEAAYTGSLAAGSALAPVLLVVFSVGQSFQATAIALGLVAVALVPALLAIARVMTVPRARYELLRTLPMFRPLPVPAVELLARSAAERQVAAHTVVVHEGDQGDEFFAIQEGRLLVSVAGREVTRLGAGDHFGEIALLRDSVRTTSVTAETEAILIVVGRHEFLDAVTGHSAAAQALAAAVTSRLEREPGLLATNDSGG